jgi:threonine dehydrogenase-like Zn-dependent dehydrogenase
MRATLMYGAGDVRVEDVPDSKPEQPTDALVRITATCVCGSDLHPYATMAPGTGPAHMGHEFIGVIEEIGHEVSTLNKGDLVVAPFAFSDGTCQFCRFGLQTSCEHGGFWDMLQAKAAKPRRSGSRSPTAPCLSSPAGTTRR